MNALTPNEIEKEYDRLLAATENVWNCNPGTGQDIGMPAGYFDFGISIGSYFQPNDRVVDLLDELKSLNRSDSKHILIPEACYHFTFLALASHVFSKDQPLPPEVDGLKKICDTHLSIDSWQLQKLRIVPGANYLLLVGTPSAELVAMRRRFVDALYASSWAIHLKFRHENKGYPFPPRIWHTTLCRYTAEYLSKEARDLFRRYRDQDFGDVRMDAPQLRRVNYDWSATVLIE